jgi:hypothetical protein
MCVDAASQERMGERLGIYVSAALRVERGGAAKRLVCDAVIDLEGGKVEGGGGVTKKKEMKE